MNTNSIVLIALYEFDSFSIRILHAVLKKKGFDVHSVFLHNRDMDVTMGHTTKHEIELVMKIIRQKNPAFVGIHVLSTFFKLAKNLTEQIKKQSDALVVWGGVHPTTCPDQCIDIADIVCLGEGEDAIIELAQNLQDQRSIKKIRNLWVKDKKIHRNPLRQLIENLDSIPVPYFGRKDVSFVDKNKIIPTPPAKLRTRYRIMASRGCLFSCSYCCNCTLREIYKGKGTYFRRRSVDNFITELELATRMFQNLNFIVIEDDIFTYDIKWIREFSWKYKKKIGLPFICYYQPNTAKPEMASLLKKAGVSKVIVSIQSGSQRIQKDWFNRHMPHKSIIRASRLLKKKKIKVAFYDLILDNPIENTNDRRATLNLLLKLQRPFSLRTFSLTHFPQTVLTDRLLKAGVINESEMEDKKQKSYERWRPSLDFKRNNENLFWDNIYYLAGRSWIPKWLVRKISHSRGLKSNPRPLTVLLRLTSPELSTVRHKSLFDNLRYNLVSFITSPLGFVKKTQFYKTVVLNS